MARGWESKSIEAQQQEAANAVAANVRPRTPEEREQASRRRTLELARARAVADLSGARTPAHRQMLERAIADLDAELGRL
jgi:hypothetical protein